MGSEEEGRNLQKECSERGEKNIERKEEKNARKEEK